MRASPTPSPIIDTPPVAVDDDYGEPLEGSQYKEYSLEQYEDFDYEDDGQLAVVRAMRLDLGGRADLLSRVYGPTTTGTAAEVHHAHVRDYAAFIADIDSDAVIRPVTSRMLRSLASTSQLRSYAVRSPCHEFRTMRSRITRLAPGAHTHHPPALYPPTRGTC